MVPMRGLLLAFLVVGCIAAVGGTKQDGRPRPRPGLTINDDPDMSYGPTPTTYEAGLAADCEWYGWASTVFANTPNYGTVCMSSLRRFFLNTTISPPGSLEPFVYYWSSYFADASNRSYCYLGCFDLSASSPPPLGSLYPPPPADVPPTEAPPLESPPAATPPASIFPPPPSGIAVPPPMDETMPPPPVPLGTPPSTGTPPGTGTPPATRTINLNGGFVVQPSGLVAVFVAGAAYLLNQIFV